MSYDTAKYIYPEDKSWGVFSGGIVTNTPNTHLGNQFTPYARNFRLRGQWVMKRPWFIEFASLSGTWYPKGIGSYLRANPANDVMVVRQNVDSTHKLVTIDESATVTSIDTASNITTDDRMTFTNIGDVIYCMNGTNFGKLNGTTYTNILSSSHLASAPSYSVSFASCHWASGLTGASTANKVYKSPSNNQEDWTAAGNDSFTFPENITGMNVAGQAIFVFTSNTIHTCTLGDQTEAAWVVTFSFKPIQASEGAVNNSCIVSVWANLYYLSSSNKINKIARGSNVYGFEVVELSDRKYKGITELISTLDPDQSDAFAQYYPEQSIIKWFMKERWSTVNNKCIIYDVEKDMFLYDTNKVFYDATYFKGQVYSVSMFETDVFKDEYGTEDNGSWIDFELWTKAFDEWEYTMRKWYWESRTDVQITELASLTQEIYTNSFVNEYGESYGTLIDSKTINSDTIAVLGGGIGTQMTGTFPIGMEWVSAISQYPIYILRTKGNLNKRGNSIQFRYYDNTKWQVYLNRLGYKMEILPSLTSSLTP